MPVAAAPEAAGEPAPDQAAGQPTGHAADHPAEHRGLPERDAVPAAGDVPAADVAAAVVVLPPRGVRRAALELVVADADPLHLLQLRALLGRQLPGRRRDLGAGVEPEPRTGQPGGGEALHEGPPRRGELTGGVGLRHQRTGRGVALRGIGERLAGDRVVAGVQVGDVGAQPVVQRLDVGAVALEGLHALLAGPQVEQPAAARGEQPQQGEDGAPAAPAGARRLVAGVAADLAAACRRTVRGGRRRRADRLREPLSRGAAGGALRDAVCLACAEAGAAARATGDRRAGDREEDGARTQPAADRLVHRAPAAGPLLDGAGQHGDVHRPRGPADLGLEHVAVDPRLGVGVDVHRVLLQRAHHLCRGGQCLLGRRRAGRQHRQPRHDQESEQQGEDARAACHAESVSPDGCPLTSARA